MKPKRRRAARQTNCGKCGSPFDRFGCTIVFHARFTTVECNAPAARPTDVLLEEARAEIRRLHEQLETLLRSQKSVGLG